MAKKPEPFEKHIENQILSWLALKKIFAFKHDSVGIFDPVKKTYRIRNNVRTVRGVSDILGILPGGRFLAIEVKRPSGVVSEHQQTFLNAVNQAGGAGFVARSLQDVIDKLSPATNTSHKAAA